MKRFALTTCLAACLVFAFGATAMGANSVTVESVAGFINSAGTAEVQIVNDVELRGLNIPVVVRAGTGGCYPTALSAEYPSDGRLDVVPQPFGGNGYLYEVNFLNGYESEDGTCKGGAAGGFGTIDATLSGNTTTINTPGDPDAFLFARNRQTGANMPVGDDAASGNPSALIHFTCPGDVGDFTIDTTCVNPAGHFLMINDAGGAIATAVFIPAVIECNANQCPTGSYADVSGTVGTPMSNPVINPDDVEGDAIEYFMVSSLGAVDQNTGLWTYTPTCGDLAGFTVEIEITDKGEGSCPNHLTFRVDVSPTPIVPQCSDVTVHWGAVAAQTITASGGCPAYTFGGGAPGAVDPASGDWSYPTDCADVGTTPVTVTVGDQAGQQVNCNFDLTVTNTAPTCSDPADITVPNDGLQYCVTLGPATDADGDPITYEDAGGGPSWGSIVGNQWCGTRDGGDDAEYTMCFQAYDGCERSAVCCFHIQFESPYFVCFSEPTPEEKYAVGPIPYVHTLGGRNAEICVWVDPATGSSKGVGGFDFLICYDNSILTFIEATRGEDLHPDWEYFTWRTGMFGGNCGGACPNGFVRLVGITDMNNGIAPDPAAFTLKGNVVCLTFFVTGDVNFTGTCAHVGFCSYDCGDNVISSKDGNTLFLGLAGMNLGPDYDIEECLASQKVPAELFIVFCQGGICIDAPPDDRGDINLNGIPNEVGDAVLFSNYFIYGPSVWDPVWMDTQIFATDINNDGLTLTIADLVYLIRILTGDEQPFTDPHENPKVSPYANSVKVITDVSNGALTVRTDASVELGGAMLVYRYSGMTIGEADLAIDGMTMKTRAHNGELRVLVYPDADADASGIPTGLNNLVTIPVEGNGTIELVESQVSDYSGALLSVQEAKKALPTSFALHQNFPNPFNAGTVIPLSLKDASDWTVTIYNVAGQVVNTFSGYSEAGTVNVQWNGRAADGSEVASGMYFYRATAANFTATKKMVLLK
jgi:hypothetical protein